MEQRNRKTCFELPVYFTIGLYTLSLFLANRSHFWKPDFRLKGHDFGSKHLELLREKSCDLWKKVSFKSHFVCAVYCSSIFLRLTIGEFGGWRW